MSEEKSLREMAELALDGKYTPFDVFLSDDKPNFFYEKGGPLELEKHNFYNLTEEQQCMFLLFVEISEVQ